MLQSVSNTTLISYCKEKRTLQSDHLRSIIREEGFRDVILMDDPIGLLAATNFPCIESQSPLLTNHSFELSSYDLIFSAGNLPKPSLGGPADPFPVVELVIGPAEVEPLVIIGLYRRQP